MSGKYTTVNEYHKLAAEATRRPWRANSCLIYREVQGVHVHTEGVARTDIGLASRDGQCANARLIVRAVNAHDDLVAACKRAIAFYGGSLRALGTPWDEMKAALAKAEGKE